MCTFFSLNFPPLEHGFAKGKVYTSYDRYPNKSQDFKKGFICMVLQGKRQEAVVVNALIFSPLRIFLG